MLVENIHSHIPQHWFESGFLEHFNLTFYILEYFLFSITYSKEEFSQVHQLADSEGTNRINMTVAHKEDVPMHPAFPRIISNSEFNS